MSKITEVVVTGGGHNLYEISESSGEFYVYHVLVRIVMNDRRNIGKTKTFDQALNVIRSHSGKGIKRVG